MLAPQRRPAVVFQDGPTLFQGFEPTAPVSRCVALIWMTSGPIGSRREKVLPNGVVELIVNLGAPHRVVDPVDPARHVRYRHSWLAGMQRSFIVIAAEQDTELVGIRFRPGGAHALFGRPLCELSDAVVELELLDRALAAELRERLLEAPAGVARVEVVEAVLRRRLDFERGDPRVEAWVRVLAEAPCGASIARVAAGIGVSHKHLIHLCRQQVGLTPKLLARVLRFSAVIRGVHGVRTPRWAEIAAAFGYGDQAHLIAEFHAFTGGTPSDYWQSRYVDPNHLIVSG